MTKTQTILVTESDGPVGLGTIRHLVNSKHPHHIIAGIPGDLEDNLNVEVLRKLGDKVEVVQIDSRDKEGLKKMMEKVDRVFVVPSWEDDRIGHEKSYIEAAQAAKVQHLVLLSTIMAENRKDLLGKQYHQLEQRVLASKMNHTIIRAGFYQQYLLLFKNAIMMDGVLPMPTGDGLFAPVDAEDVGSMAAHVLEFSEKYVNQIFNITGPETLSSRDIAKHLSRILGKTITFKDTDAEEAREHMGSFLPNTGIAEAIKEEQQLISQGKLNFVSPHFKEVTRCEARTSDQFFLQHREELALNVAEE